MDGIDNLAEYEDPDLYDQENPEDAAESAFYRALAEETGGPLLDLGCGTGRHTIPLARLGFEVTGLEVVPAMLERARAKAAKLPIQWIAADARTFRLDKRYGLIFESGSVFMHMLSNNDQRAFLARVSEHLAPGGLFVVSLFFPHPQQLQSDPEEKEWYSYQDAAGRSVRVSGTEMYDELRQVKLETAVRTITSSDGSQVVKTAPLRLRYTFPQEMETLLDACGLAINARYGGYDRAPLTTESSIMIFVCGLKTP